MSAESEVDEILLGLFDAGLSPSASIALGDVRRAMIVCWKRGYSACREDVIHQSGKLQEIINDRQS